MLNQEGLSVFYIFIHPESSHSNGTVIVAGTQNLISFHFWCVRNSAELRGLVRHKRKGNTTRLAKFQENDATYAHAH